MVTQELKDSYRHHRQMTGEYRAAGCLKSARKDVAAGQKRYPHRDYLGPRGAWQPAEVVVMYPHLKGAYAISRADLGLRIAGYADECAKGLRHTGWYTDDNQDSKLRGIVVQLTAKPWPGPRGYNGRSCRYIAGYEESDNDGLMLYPAEMYDTVYDAAVAADRLAEIAAERAREYNEAWQAGSRVADLESQAREVRKEIRDLGRTMREALADKIRQSVWTVLRTQLGNLEDTIGDLYSKRSAARFRTD